MNNSILSEDVIERVAEWKLDELDTDYLEGKITKEKYNDEVSKLNIWVERKYKLLKGE